MKRTLDGAFLSLVANDPCVRPWLGGEGPIDLGPVAEDPANVVLESETGGFVLQKLDAGLYEAHSIFLPKSREAPKLAQDGFRYMFTATDCLEIVSKVPANNRRAHGLARWCGLQETFRRARAWNGHDVSYRSLTFDRWKARDPELRGHGEWFHSLLDAAKARGGSNLPVHADDEAHDRAVGAAVLMIRAGNAAKAVWTYNRWAVFAGYSNIRMISQNPVLLDVGDAIVDRAEVLMVKRGEAV